MSCWMLTSTCLLQHTHFLPLKLSALPAEVVEGTAPPVSKYLRGHEPTSAAAAEGEMPPLLVGYGQAL
jgi:hypothetical protein